VPSACFRSGRTLIIGSTGNVERVIPFDDENSVKNVVIETHGARLSDLNELPAHALAEQLAPNGPS
jgi:hypothetical protein